MKKKIWFVFFAAVFGAACFGEGVMTKHEYGDVCEAYSLKEVQVLYANRFNSSEEAGNYVYRFASHIDETYKASKATYIEKPYKNEIDSVWNLITKYYSPTKNDLYIVQTTMSFDPYLLRTVFYWLSSSQQGNYWILEIGDK